MGEFRVGLEQLDLKKMRLCDSHMCADCRVTVKRDKQVFDLCRRCTEAQKMPYIPVYPVISWLTMEACRYTDCLSVLSLPLSSC